MRVLIVESKTEPRDPLFAELAEVGHEARDAQEAIVPVGEIPWKPDVLVVRLEKDSAAVLDSAERLLSDRRFAGAPLLFTGGNELALMSARRRFPDASFVRIDQIVTALASLEANE